MNSLSNICNGQAPFLIEIFKLINFKKISLDALTIDHICYRVETTSEYEHLKIELLNISQLLTESHVNGRPISIFKLNNPIVFKNFTIALLELPAPKKGHSYKTGYEHIEFVTPLPLHEIVKANPDCQFQTLGINKNINADITLPLGPYCIRFHNESLEEIIKKEKAHV